MLRGFTDSQGVEWRVWEVFPTATSQHSSADAMSLASLKETPFANGWLCFEGGDQKRRLAPIPNGWEMQELAELEALCDRATHVTARRRTS
jgi:hypothetical protein